MTASAVHGVAYTVGPLFKHIIDCMQLYFTNGFTNTVLQSVNCLWLGGVILIFDGTPQIIVQRWQIAALRWPNDINSAAEDAIFKNREQRASSVASAVWHVCVRVFWATNATILLVYIPVKIKMSFIWKDDFFAKIDIFYKSIAGPLSEALFKRTHNHVRSAEG